VTLTVTPTSVGMCVPVKTGVTVTLIEISTVTLTVTPTVTPTSVGMCVPVKTGVTVTLISIPTVTLTVTPTLVGIDAKLLIRIW